MRRIRGWETFCDLLRGYVDRWKRLDVAEYRDRKGIVWDGPKKGRGHGKGCEIGRRPNGPNRVNGKGSESLAGGGIGSQGCDERSEFVQDDPAGKGRLDDFGTKRREKNGTQLPKDKHVTARQVNTSHSVELSNTIRVIPDLPPPPSPNSNPLIQNPISVSRSIDTPARQSPSPHPTAFESLEREFPDYSPTPVPEISIATITPPSLSLVQLTANLLMARQRGRLTEFRTRWQLIALDKYTYHVSFEGNPIPGIIMERVDSEPSTRKICIFGCVQNGTHQWLSSSEYLSHLPFIISFPYFCPVRSNVSRQKAHISPNLSGAGKCRRFPACLSATSAAEFSSSRSFEGLRIYFRRTREGRGHLTSLRILGDGLLDYAIRQLGMSELHGWREVEMGDVGDMGARKGIFGEAP